MEPHLDPAARFLSAETTDERVGVTLSADGRRAEIRAIVPPGARSGDIAAVVSLKTDNARQPRCTVHVQGDCKPAVEVNPRSVTVASGVVGPHECELAIVGRIDALVVKAASVSDPRVVVRMVEAGGGPRIRLSIPECGTTPIVAELRLVLEDGNSRESKSGEFQIVVPVVRLGKSQ